MLTISQHTLYFQANEDLTIDVWVNDSTHPHPRCILHSQISFSDFVDEFKLLGLDIWYAPRKEKK